jgi:hypothetical protein
MARRWYVPLLAFPVAIGTVVAVLEGVASASPGLAHAAARTAAVQRLFPGAPMISPSGPAVPGLRGGVNATATSSNWAGYVLQGRSGAFRSVSASWVEPRVTCTGVRGRRFAAFWVGLDGANPNPLVPPTVEQTGADSDCVRNQPTYYGWFEMFPAPPVVFHNAIRAGDHMSASVRFSGTRTYVLVLTDHTRRWTHIITKNERGLKRASAEVIAEAPTLVSAGGQQSLAPLANFHTMRWTGSKVNGTLLRNLPRRIRIIMTRDPGGGPVKCQTSLVSTADAFTNTYVRAT